MNNRKFEKALYLFDEIGLIDDELIQSAEHFNKKLKRNNLVIFQRLAVACILMISSISIMFFSFQIYIFNKKKDSENIPQLQEVLLDFRQSSVPIEQIYQNGYTIKKQENVDFFDRKVKFIWQYPDEQTLYVITFENQYLANKLTSEINKPKNYKSGYTQECYVWVSLGNGEIISPFLKNSQGNVAYGELFEYQYEVLPSPALAELIAEILS